MTETLPVITIDGPSGTGKGTVSRIVAHKLGWNLLDSGVLYRVLAMAANIHRIRIEDDAALTTLACHLDVQFDVQERGELPRIILEGEDVTDKIRTETMGNQASQLGAIAAVRAALLDRQRAFCRSPGLVTDGRDMGTVVFPQAMLKIYLDARTGVRVERRYQQLKQKGNNVTLQQVENDLLLRDKRDKQRQAAPLYAAKDAVVIDTSDLNVDQVCKQVLAIANERLEKN